MSEMDGKVAIVTGASSGIGIETVRALASMGTHVVMAVRDIPKAERVRNALLAENPQAKLELMRVDLARLRDVRRFTRTFRDTHDRLDVLVNNAGFHVANRVETEDGYESTFAVNHLAHFMLTTDLLKLLKANAPARVVTVASEAHRGQRLDLDDLQAARRWNGFNAYGRAKLANILFAFELARRCEGTGVTSNALHPGVVRTGWGRGDSSGVLRLAVKLVSPFMLSPEAGARTSIYLAAAPDVEGVTGTYFAKSTPKRASREANDEAVAKRLWEESEALVQRALGESEPATPASARPN